MAEPMPLPAAHNVTAPAAALGQEWVQVTHAAVGPNDPPAFVTREWLDGWGKAKGWSEVKSK